MIFQGSEAISQATRVTGRTVLTFSATLLFWSLSWIEGSETSVIGLKFSSGSFGWVLASLIVMSMLAHVVQWYGDWASIRGWNILGYKVADLQLSNGKAAETRLQRFEDNVEELGKKQENESTEISSQIKLISSELPDFTKSVRHYGRYAWFYIYAWHLGVPLGLAAIALLAAYYV